VCQYCNAVFWYNGRIVSESSYSSQRIVYRLCCHENVIKGHENVTMMEFCCYYMHYRKDA
jgi:hypothetical protein